MVEWNKRILCVDDEETILELYKSIFSPQKEDDIDNILARRKKQIIEDAQEIETNILLTNPNYEVILANSGESAIELFKKELYEGHQIAVGFFDMKMPGIDGMETISELKKLDPSILCVIVTAYTDRSIEQIATIFEKQDEWVYLNKPFTAGEVRQLASNLVSSWNYRKQKKELDEKIQKKNDELIRTYKQIISSKREMKESVSKFSEYVKSSILQMIKDINPLLDGKLGDVSDEQYDYLMDLQKKWEKMKNEIISISTKIIDKSELSNE